MELPNVRSLFHSLLDKHLAIDAAAERLQIWSDKVAERPIRRWDHMPEGQRELYRLLTYGVACTLVGEPQASSIAYHMDLAIAEASKEVVAAGYEGATL